MPGEISRTYDGPDDESMVDRIRQDRQNGMGLGDLQDKYGTTAVVAALGVEHIARSLGVWDQPEEYEPPDWPEEQE